MRLRFYPLTISTLASFCPHAGKSFPQLPINFPKSEQLQVAKLQTVHSIDLPRSFRKLHRAKVIGLKSSFIKVSFRYMYGNKVSKSFLMETDQSIDFNNFSHKSFHALQGKVVLVFVETYQASFSYPLL